MAFDIEKIKSKKILYGINLASKNPEIFKLNIVDIEINSVVGYKQIIFSLKHEDSKNIWYASIFDKFVNNKFNHGINDPFNTFLTNKLHWEPIGYKMYNFMFSFSKSKLSKEYINYIKNTDQDLQDIMNNMNNANSLNNIIDLSKIKLIQK